MKKWSSENFGAVTKQNEEQRTKLDHVRALRNNADSHAVREALDKMNELLYRKEMMWLQRSRINCLREGDRSKYKNVSSQSSAEGKEKLHKAPKE